MQQVVVFFDTKHPYVSGTSNKPRILLNELLNRQDAMHGIHGSITKAHIPLDMSEAIPIHKTLDDFTYPTISHTLIALRQAIRI